MLFHEAEVTRSLSNLYKQSFGIREERGIRVIDSNEIIAKKLQEQQLTSEFPQRGGTDPDGFSPGLFAEEVEVVPEIDYVAEAKAEAEEILAEAKAQAEAICQESRNQAEEVREAARNEGWQKGYEESTARAEQELALKLAELEETKQELNRDYEERLKNMEPQLLDAILQVVEKVFHIQFGDKKEILLYLLTNAINGIEGCKNFQIRVGQENYRFVNNHKEEIVERIGNDITIEVIADPVIAEDKCMIETDVGVFDCSLGVQLENLIKALRSLGT